MKPTRAHEATLSGRRRWRVIISATILSLLIPSISIYTLKACDASRSWPVFLIITKHRVGGFVGTSIVDLDRVFGPAIQLPGDPPSLFRYGIGRDGIDNVFIECTAINGVVVSTNILYS